MKRPGSKSKNKNRKPVPQRRPVTPERERVKTSKTDEVVNKAEDEGVTQMSSSLGDDSIEVNQRSKEVETSLSEILMGEVAVVLPFLVLEFGIFYVSGAGPMLSDSFSGMFEAPFSAASFAFAMCGVYLLVRVFLRSGELVRHSAVARTGFGKGAASMIAIAMISCFIWNHIPSIQETFLSFYSKNVIIMWINKNWEYTVSEWSYFCRLFILIVTFQFVISVLAAPFLITKWIFARLLSKQKDNA